MIIEAMEVNGDALEAGRRYVNCEIHIEDRLIVEDLVFERCIFHFVDVEKFELIHVMFENCDLSNMSFYDGYLRNVTFKGCKLMATSIAKAYVNTLEIVGCMAHYFGINQTKVEGLKMHDTDWSFGSFQNNTFKNMTLKDCKINELQLMETNLKGLDLRSCVFDVILYTPHLVRGLKISMDQAVVFARLMGIVVD